MFKAICTLPYTPVFGRRHFVIQRAVSLPSNHNPWTAPSSARSKANAAYTCSRMEVTSASEEQRGFKTSRFPQSVLVTGLAEAE